MTQKRPSFGRANFKTPKLTGKKKWDGYGDFVFNDPKKACPYCGDANGPGECTEQANCLNIHPDHDHA